MNQEQEPTQKPVAWVLIAYALICTLALGFDLSTDRSFGALMLSVLPMSFLVLACLFVGPWLEYPRRSIARRAWAIGSLLILIVSLAFSLLGADQARTGEVIFTYAAMIMALPSSLLLPFVEAWLAPMLGDFVIARIASAWTFCVVGGWLEWKVLEWLYDKIKRRLRGQFDGKF